MINIQPIVINFTSKKEVEAQSYQVIIDSIDTAFKAARGNLEKMEELHQLSKELRFQTQLAIDELLRGPVIKKEALAPEVQS